MSHFNFNGKLYPNNKAIIGPDNRGLRYGDGLFETLKYADGKLILIDEHLSRLWKGLKLLRFEIPKLFTAERLQGEIMELVKKNGLSSARIRLNVFRGDAANFDSQNHNPQYVIQCWPLEPVNALNSNGLQLCIYTEAKKNIDTFSNIKHNNYLPYFMANIFAKEQKCNDAIVLNIHGRVCDSTIANIFLIKDKVIYTCPLHEGCIAGVMRKTILAMLGAQGLTCVETEISTEFLLNADEVFLTNSIYNLRWVASIGSKNYTNTYTAQIFQLLKETSGEVFC